MIKAEVISTGERVFVEECGYDYTCNSKIFRDKEGLKYLSYDLTFIESYHTPYDKINWEQRRFELVKAISVKLFDLPVESQERRADDVINLADIIITKLKHEKQRGTQNES